MRDIFNSDSYNQSAENANPSRPIGPHYLPFVTMTGVDNMGNTTTGATSLLIDATHWVHCTFWAGTKYNDYIVDRILVGFKESVTSTMSLMLCDATSDPTAPVAVSGDTVVRLLENGNYYRYIDASPYLHQDPNGVYYFVIKNDGGGSISLSTSGLKFVIDYDEALLGANEAPLVTTATSDRDALQVNTLKGKGVYRHKIVTINDQRLPFTLEAVYNPYLYNKTTDHNAKFFAKGWKWNLTQYLYQSNGIYYYVDGLGETHKLVACANQSSVYYEEGTQSGLHLTVGSNIILSDGVQTQIKFSTSNKLSTLRILGEDGTYINPLNNSTNGIYSILTDADEAYLIEYASTYIKVKRGSTVVASMVLSDGVLQSITRENLDGSSTIKPTTNFGYDATGRLQTITASDTNKRLVIDYNASQRVISYALGTSNGSTVRTEQYVTFGYLPGKTVVTYRRNNAGSSPYSKYEYVFDERGRLRDQYEALDGSANKIVWDKQQTDLTAAYISDNYTSLGSFVFDPQDPTHIPPIHLNNPSITGIVAYGLPTGADTDVCIYLSYQLGASSPVLEPSINVYCQYGYPSQNMVLELDGLNSYKAVMPLRVPSGTTSIQVQITSTNYSGHCSFDCIELRCNKFAYRQDVINQNTGISSVLTANGITWYPLKKCNINYDSGSTLSNVLMTAKDINRTIRSMSDNTSSYTCNLWYDNGKMLTGVSAVSLQFGSGSYIPLTSIRAASLGLSDKRYQYSYIVRTSGGYKVVNGIVASDNTSAVAESYEEYDLQHNPTARTDIYGVKSIIGYGTPDANNNVIRTYTTQTPTADATIVTRTHYNKNRYPTADYMYRYSVTLAKTMSYNANRKLSSMTTYGNHTYNYTYQSADVDKLTGVESVDATSITNTIGYSGEKISSLNTTGGGTAVSFGYDLYQQPNSASIGTGFSLTKLYTYQSNGSTVVQTTSGGLTIKRTYDCYGRLIKVQHGTTTVQTFIYSDKPLTNDSLTDPTDSSLVISRSSPLRRVCEFSPTKTTDYAYDYVGRNASVTVKYAGVTEVQITNAFDAYGRVSGRTISFGNTNTLVVGFDYASAVDDTVVAVHNNYNSATTVTQSTTFDTLRRVFRKDTAFTSSLGIRSTMDYCQDGVPNSGGDTTDFVSKVVYSKLSGGSDGDDLISYDADGNITNNGTTAYRYDAHGRLVQENNLQLDCTYSYVYDSRGNITYKYLHAYTNNISTPGPITGTYANTYDTGTNAWYDKPLTLHGASCTYDTAGRPTQYRNQSMSWTRGRLTSYKNITMTYDGNGVRRTKGGITYQYLDGVLLSQYDGSTTLRFFYGTDGVIGFQKNNEVYLYRRNLLGDIIGIYDSTNTLVAKYAYNAWGEHKVLNPDGSVNTGSTFIGNINPLRYRGYYYDADLGLYYLMTRYYDPEVGRFISADGIEYLDPETIGGLNLFAYCNNNPVMGVDPDGTKWFSGLLLQLGISVASYIGFAVASLFDKDIKQDMDAIGWNPFNSDEQTVIDATKVSFYKGIPFIQANFDRGGYLGAIFWDGSDLTADIRHEYGHALQQIILGPFAYALLIGLPSWKEWSKRSYYNRPWELSADLLGEAKRDDSSNAPSTVEKNRAWAYLATARLFGPLAFLFLLEEL